MSDEIKIMTAIVVGIVLGAVLASCQTPEQVAAERTKQGHVAYYIFDNRTSLCFAKIGYGIARVECTPAVLLEASR